MNLSPGPVDNKGLNCYFRLIEKKEDFDIKYALIYFDQVQLIISFKGLLVKLFHIPYSFKQILTFVYISIAVIVKVYPIFVLI